MQQNSSNAVKTLDRIEMLIEYLQRELADIRNMIGKRPIIDPPPVSINAAKITDGSLAESREKAEEVAQQKLTEAHRGTVDPPTRTMTSDSPPPTQQEMEEATRRASEPPEPGTAARERQARSRTLPFGGVK